MLMCNVYDFTAIFSESKLVEFLWKLGINLQVLSQTYLTFHKLLGHVCMVLVIKTRNFVVFDRQKHFAFQVHK